ncbi:MAG: host attachment protein [Gammaproteobacteria bacterium]|nr:host attachment protein [Gammaproteobacteria bacterium]
MTTWVLVANTAGARIYQSENLRVDNLNLIKELPHPEGRKKISELISDHLGHYKSDTGSRGAFSKGDPKENEAEHFAIMLAKELKTEHEQNKYQDLVLVMPAHFHALLAKHLRVTNNVVHIAKDYTKYALPKLTQALREHLFVLK